MLCQDHLSQLEGILQKNADMFEAKGLIRNNKTKDYDTFVKFAKVMQTCEMLASGF